MYSSLRHGHLLKKYIEQNKLNRKGGINGLATELGVSRQGVYVLYKQEVIKKRYREKIIAYFDLDRNFFPDPKEIEETRNRDYNKFLNVSVERNLLLDDLKEIKDRMKLRWYLQNERINYRKGNQEGCLHVVTGLSFEYYYYHWKNPFYIRELPRIEDDFLAYGFAFEITDNSMIDQGYIRGDFACSCTLLEFPEDIVPDQYYFIIFEDEEMDTHGLCRQLEYNSTDDAFMLSSERKEIKEFVIGYESVSQIWLIEHVIRLTPEDYIQLASLE